MANELTREISKELIAHLVANMPSIEKAYDDFPNPEQELEYPCLSVFMRTPDYEPCMPYVIYKGAKIFSGPDENKVPVRKVVGSYEFALQIDLWCQSKPQRHEIYEEFFRAFHKDHYVAGISLQLDGYYNEWARFDLDGIEFVDSEQGSQRNEWRVLINVKANCKAITAQNEFIIETIENNLETPDDIESPPESGGTLPI